MPFTTARCNSCRNGHRRFAALSTQTRPMSPKCRCPLYGACSRPFLTENAGCCRVSSQPRNFISKVRQCSTSKCPVSPDRIREEEMGRPLIPPILASLNRNHRRMKRVIVNITVHRQLGRPNRALSATCAETCKGVKKSSNQTKLQISRASWR